MLLTTRVKFVLAESPTTGIPGVKVELYDRDSNDEDDLLATEVSDDQGEILFSFDSEEYADAEDQELWRLESLPDQYVKVYDAQGQIVLSTRSETLEDQLPKLITVPISQELVDQHGLMLKD
jgi:hypothetical protein